MQQAQRADDRSPAHKPATLSYDALAAIVDAVDDAIISHSLNGEITDWSAGAQRMLGFAPAEAIGHRIDRLLREGGALSRVDFASALAVLEKAMTPITGRLAAAYTEIDLPFAELPTREQLLKDSTDKNRAIATRAKHLLQMRRDEIPRPRLL